MEVKYNLADKRAYLRVYLQVVDCMSSLQTTDSEKEVLIDFLLLPEQYRPFMFSALAKNKVLESYTERGETMSMINLNNKIYSLINKKFLVREVDDTIVMRNAILQGAIRLLKALENGKSYQIIFDFNKDEEKF